VSTKTSWDLSLLGARVSAPLDGREALGRLIRPHVLIVDEVGYLGYGDAAANVV
jgi:hypothetical protein